jgi:hypothetical protein
MENINKYSPPEPLLPKGTRVRFVAKWQREFGMPPIPVGQTGVVTGSHSSVLVDLDGFEEEKAAHYKAGEEIFARTGGYPSCVTEWHVGVPLNVLEVIHQPAPCEHERLNDHGDGDACLDCGAAYIDGNWQ